MKIVKVATSDGSLGKNIGCEKAPDKIITELNNLFTNEDFKKLNYKIVKEKGDLYLGGDHSISYDSFKEFTKKFNNPGLIVFDAHPDIFQNFNKPCHEDWLLFLINEKILKKENVVLVGIRNADVKEIEYLKKNNIKFFTMKQLFENIESICDSVMEFTNKFDGLYISIDIDVVDPGYAPGTGYLEPGGLTSRELIYFIQRLKKLKNLKMVDIVEVNPNKDVNDITSKLAAKIIGELM